MRRIDLIISMIETERPVREDNLIAGCPGFYDESLPSARSFGCKLQEIGAHPDEAYEICKTCWYEEVDDDRC
ncbi:MAG: hypothetical protein CVU95_08380 [Firmicutes bacterium HGW-Firmicutes-2]|nr:MAG: hypothetical protein CVU95_08380 [Firmicutes bacterium HGW-Firmicutes-2]